MKIVLTLLIAITTFNAVATDKKAITDNGEIVILKSDGTWSYESELVKQELTLNPTVFSRNNKSTFQLKSKTNSSSFWIDPKKWFFKQKNNGHDVAEYTLGIKGSDIYGMVITEGISMDVEALASTAFSNAQAAAPNIKVTKKEYRTVNGHKVIYMEMQGTIQTIDVSYFGYYFTDESGSTQYLAYTGSNLVDKYADDIATLLNGFDIQ